MTISVYVNTLASRVCIHIAVCVTLHTHVSEQKVGSILHPFFHSSEMVSSLLSTYEQTVVEPSQAPAPQTWNDHCTYTSLAQGPRTYRALQRRAQTPLTVAFVPAGDVHTGAAEWTRAHRTFVPLLTGSVSSGGLPPNVHLLSFEPVRSADCAGCVLVRLAHVFEAAGAVGWDPELSAPAEVDLGRLFPNRVVVAVEEVLLSGVPLRGGARDRGRDALDAVGTTAGTGVGPVDTVVTLGPMQIRALRVRLEE